MIEVRRSLKVRMDMVNRCNLRCRMCHVSLENVGVEPRREMTVELFSKIAAEVLPRARSLTLTVGYEPLLCKSFPEILEIASTYNVPHFAYTTNATLLDSRIIDATLRAGINEIIVSLDGATKETYDHIRRGARLEKVLANIQNLQDAKRRAGTDLPRLSISMVLMRQNIEELSAMVRLAAQYGFKGVTATHVVPFEGLDIGDETLNHHPALANACFDEARAVAEELGIYLKAPENFPDGGVEPPTNSNNPARLRDPEIGDSGKQDALESQAPAVERMSVDPDIVSSVADERDERRLEEEVPVPVSFPIEDTEFHKPFVPPESSCHWPWTDVVIFSDGSVSPCCFWFDNTIMGQLQLESFDEIWNGAQYSELRTQLTTNSPRESCRKCPMNRDSGRMDEELFSEIRRPDVTLQIKIQGTTPQQKPVLIGRLLNQMTVEKEVRIRVRFNGRSQRAQDSLEANISLPPKSEYVSSIPLPQEKLRSGTNHIIAEVRDAQGVELIYETSISFTADSGTEKCAESSQ